MPGKVHLAQHRPGMPVMQRSGFRGSDVTSQILLYPSPVEFVLHQELADGGGSIAGRNYDDRLRFHFQGKYWNYRNPNF